MAALYKGFPGSALWLPFTDEVRRLTTAWRDGYTAITRYGEHGPRTFERPPETIVEGIRNHAFVAMDDIGTRAPTDSQYDAIYAFIAAREGKATAYTTNLSPAALAKLYDDRIVSRLLAGTVIEMDDVDRRLED